MGSNNSFDAMLDRVAALGSKEKKTIQIAENISLIIDALSSARIKKGFTQRQLAEKCGLKQSAIARIETLQVIPRLDTLLKIAQCLGVSICVETETTTVSKGTNVRYINDYREGRYKWKNQSMSMGGTAVYGNIG